MTKTDEIYDEAKSEGKVPENKYLKFKGTGKHTLKFVRDEVFMGKNYRTGYDEKKMRYYFLENSEEKIYETAIFRMSQSLGKVVLTPFIRQIKEQGIQYGDTFTAEYTPIKGTPRGFISVQRIAKDEREEEDDLPEINPDDLEPPKKEITEEDLPF